MSRKLLVLITAASLIFTGCIGGFREESEFMGFNESEEKCFLFLTQLEDVACDHYYNPETAEVSDHPETGDFVHCMREDCGIDVEYEEGELTIDYFAESEVFDVTDQGDNSPDMEGEFNCWTDFEEYYSTYESCPMLESRRPLIDKDIDFVDAECSHDRINLEFRNSGEEELISPFADIYIWEDEPRDLVNLYGLEFSEQDLNAENNIGVGEEVELNADLGDHTDKKLEDGEDYMITLALDEEVRTKFTARCEVG